ncbi:MAG: iron-sulfur cluster insertion protein ErpA [Beijerinckiaceae bacterium]|jgi:iron-sulfur cluster assembly accessory protein
MNPADATPTSPAPAPAAPSAAGSAEGAPPVVTERAARRVAQILAKEPEGAYLRVAVNGGGCSGFQYAFDIAPARAQDDLLIEAEGVGVLIDPVSLDFLRGARIDFVDDLMGQSFRIDNPNAASSCGCGTSFSI